jgi:hypothetical protein
MKKEEGVGTLYRLLSFGVSSGIIEVIVGAGAYAGLGSGQNV